MTYVDGGSAVVTGQLADAAGDFACLVFAFGGICETASCPVTSAVIGLCCTARYKKQGGLNAYWQTMSVHDSAVDVSAVTVHSLRPDTTYRFRVMWRSHLDDEARFTDVVVARTARTSPRPLTVLPRQLCSTALTVISAKFLSWPPCVADADSIFLPCGFVVFFFFFFFCFLFPRLISAVGDWMSTILPHMVWL